jgi:hypothetical protein
LGRSVAQGLGARAEGRSRAANVYQRINSNCRLFCTKFDARPIDSKRLTEENVAKRVSNFFYLISSRVAFCTREDTETRLKEAPSCAFGNRSWLNAH